jgi:hypothetical protein
MVYHQMGQVKCHTRKCSFIFPVFWIMKMSSRPPPTREVIAPPLSRARLLLLPPGSCSTLRIGFLRVAGPQPKLGDEDGLGITGPAY